MKVAIVFCNVDYWANSLTPLRVLSLLPVLLRCEEMKTLSHTPPLPWIHLPHAFSVVYWTVTLSNHEPK